MTTITPAQAGHKFARRRQRRGFTMVELIVATGISSIVLIAVLTAFLFVMRSAANIQNYSEMETQARRSLEQFAEDTRQASSVSWGLNATSVVLTVNTIPITYTYNSATGNFTRTIGGASSTLLSGITTFSFKAYTITTVAITDFTTAAKCTTANTNTKQIQISLSARRTRATLAGTTNTVLSARFILRNKVITV